MSGKDNMEIINKTNIEKNYIFVFLYAIGSIFIVAGHCQNGGINLAFDIFPIYSFHLGLFMFCSGYFYKSKNENELGKYAWKKIKRLIIPMFIWNIVYGLFVQLTRLKGFTIGGDFTLYNLFVQPIKNGHQYIINSKSKVGISLISCLLVIGMITPFHEVYRSIYNTFRNHDHIIRNDKIYSIGNPSTTEGAILCNKQFYAKDYENKFFYRYLAK